MSQRSSWFRLLACAMCCRCYLPRCEQATTDGTKGGGAEKKKQKIDRKSMLNSEPGTMTC